ncbi:DUF2059 domain-containing protein [Paracoccaceae bacterium Fryx2]|nr:DUF2059 domain-containing protein [Paracoccaceae bacterium Fryx2]
MLIRRLAFLLLVSVAALPLRAETPMPLPLSPEAPADRSGEVAALSDLLMIGEVIEVMRVEGIDYGTTLEAELFPGKGGAQWQAVVGLIYDPATMRQRFDAVFAREMAGDAGAIGDAAAFFGDARGQRILQLELEARRALMDPAAEEAARLSVQDMEADKAPRLEVLRTFARTNDLIESNVAGALNSNLAFFQGLAEVGPLGDEMTEDQMLADVWSQEPEIRAETEEWLFSYLALAYGPLPDDDMQAYQAFSDSPAGQKLNTALFAAFDVVFTAISRDLGRAAARQMQGEDI